MQILIFSESNLDIDKDILGSSEVIIYKFKGVIVVFFSLFILSLILGMFYLDSFV
jgi:hypothetical protein